MKFAKHCYKDNIVLIKLLYKVEIKLAFEATSL